MAINFPSAPNAGDSYTNGSLTWVYNGSAWDSLWRPTTKEQVGLGNVDNTSDINKPVSTAQQAAIDAAGGSSFDQDLNTTDSPTFATLTTTDTIATDVYAVDVAATGTVTADELSARLLKNNAGQNVFWMQSTKVICYKDWTPNGDGLLDNGTSSTRWSTVFTNDLDASGTVTADEVNFTGGGVKLNGSTRVLIRSDDTLFYRSPCPSSNEGVDLGVASRRWQTTHTVDLDATGTVTANEVSADTFTIASGVFEFNVGGTTVAQFTPGSAVVRANHYPTYDDLYTSGTSTKRWSNVFTGDVDATGTVTAGGFVGTPQTLTDAATIAYDLANGHNAKVTLTADRTLLFPTNVAEGASGVLTVTQDGTGGHALTFGSGWFISAGDAADIAALGAGEKAQVTWYAHSTSDVNATILPLQ